MNGGEIFIYWIIGFIVGVMVMYTLFRWIFDVNKTLTLGYFFESFSSEAFQNRELGYLYY